ncbi:armadillo-type protein [Lactarius hengduanensis]|nr:armadillo-type protein [Lactarius hengduanensis]
MDYLRTLGSAAVSSIVQKSGLNLPFSLGKKLPPLDTLSIWTLYDATKRDDGTPVSVFEFNSQKWRNLLPVAQNALRRLRVTRHPDILKFMDAVEADGTIYIMTERVKPLSAELSSLEATSMKDKQDWILWGLHRITVALSFVHTSCNAAHGTVRISSIFISSTGEWKLGGFELFSDPAEQNAVLVTYAGDLNIHRMPENEKGGWAALKDGPIAAIDAYALALLIFNLFNPDVSHPSFLDPPYNPPQPSVRGAIPPSIWPSFKKMLNPNPKGRITLKTLLDVGMAESLGESGGFFGGNRLFKICEGLGNFGLMTDGERATLLRMIKDVTPTLPPTFSTRLILPALLNSLSLTTMTTSAPSIVPLVVQLGSYALPDEYKTLVLEPLVKLFSNPDRGTRMALLDALPEFADKLDKQMVSDKIWPNLQTGFTDTIPVLREATVKAIGLLSDKVYQASVSAQTWVQFTPFQFTERILNNDLLRHLARLQSDLEPPIRTNSIILIGRLGPTLGPNTRRKVLGAACAKALKDSFPPARVAALMTCMACANLFDIEELAGRVVGLVAGALVDKEKIVRDQAFKAVAMLVQILEEHAAKMPETAVVGDGPTLGLSTPNGGAEATLVSSAAGAAGALAGWAISSIGKKVSYLTPSTMPSLSYRPVQFTPADMQSAISPAQTPPPPVPSESRPTFGSQAPAPPVPSSSKPKGLQLGAHKAASSGVLPGGLANEVRWDGDLMDLNADAEDWNAFESAPAPSGGGWGGTADDEDPWGAFEEPPPPPVPIPVTELTSPAMASTVTPARTHSTQAPRPARVAALSPSPSPRSTPLASPAPNEGAALPTALSPVLPSKVGMTKEEKAAEMARRKEERKQVRLCVFPSAFVGLTRSTWVRQRIAQLKEQKKNTAGTKA